MYIVRRALLIGSALAAYAIVLQVATGGRGLLRLGLTIGTVVTMYMVGALVAGLIIAVLRDWATTRLRGAIVGFVVTIPISVGFYLFLSDAETLTPRKLVAYVMLIGISLGMPAGAIIWDPK